ncbi:hypothetical protein [Streptomyces chryseus]
MTEQHREQHVLEQPLQAALDVNRVPGDGKAADFGEPVRHGVDDVDGLAVPARSCVWVVNATA